MISKDVGMMVSSGNNLQEGIERVFMFNFNGKTIPLPWHRERMIEQLHPQRKEEYETRGAGQR